MSEKFGAIANIPRIVSAFEAPGTVLSLPSVADRSKQTGKNSSEVIRVAQPLLVHPIGKVDFLLDPLLMKHP